MKMFRDSRLKSILSARVLAWMMVGLLFNSVGYAHAIQAKTIKRETAKYFLDIRFPSGFNHPGINLEVEKTIHQLKKSFLNSLADETDLPANIPGKSGLNVTYDIPFDSENITSVKLNISSYNRGAAHPNNTIQTLNFIQGRLVGYPQLFLPDSKYLQAFANYSRDQLIKNKDFDKKWVNEGTAPNADNFKIWYFSTQGLAIVFDTYQVAAYVFGPQTVSIPVAEFKTMLRPEVLKAIWGE